MRDFKDTDDSVYRLLHDTIGATDQWNPAAQEVRERPLWMIYEDQDRMRKLHIDGSSQEREPVENAALIKVPMRDEKGRSYATGRRKTAAARVWVARGDGKITVNGMDFVDYFPRVSHRVHCLDPLVATQSVGAFDVWLTVEGGGLSGQAGAVRHGIAKALVRYDPLLRPFLKQYDLLKRDPRMVERKKAGQKKARKKFQWVKR